MNGSSNRVDDQTQMWSMFIHLSQFLGFVLPVIGLLAPIVLWQTKRAEHPGIDVHGKAVANWVFSEIIYLLGCVILLVTADEDALLAFGVLGVAAVVFPIIGAAKANAGRAWRYPLSIRFIR